MTPATVAERRTEQTTDTSAIRPFRFEAPEADLIELRRRINTFETYVHATTIRSPPFPGVEIFASTFG